MVPALGVSLALAIPEALDSHQSRGLSRCKIHREEVGSMWAKITVHHQDGGKTELTCGDDGAAYPDESREVVARVLDLYRETLGVE